jgi:hypothetical protein
MLPAPAPVPGGPQPWGQPAPTAPAERNGSPWIVAFTIGISLVVVALVAVGLRAAAGRDRTEQVTEVPARRDTPQPGPSTTTAGGSSTTTTVRGSTGTTVPGGTGTTVAPPDLVTPRIRFTELDGDFEVTVPRSWINEPTPLPDQAQWVPLAAIPGGGLGRTDFRFNVRWAPSERCTLEACAAGVLDAIKATFPGIQPVTSTDTIGGIPAIRIEATRDEQRLVAWVVVKGDRLWVPQMRGPIAEFDLMVPVLRAVVATMSFG